MCIRDSDTIINHSGINIGKAGFSTMKAFDHSGSLAFWWPRVSYWNSFEVRVRNANGANTSRNRVVSVSNSTEPSSSKKVTITMRNSALYEQNQGTGVLYATTFTDSASTGYYVDPAGFSQMSHIDFNGVITGTASGAAQIGRNHAYDTVELKGYGAEFMIGAQHTQIHINHRTCNNGASSHTPTQWYWRAGTPTNFSNHEFGNVKANGTLVSTGTGTIGSDLYVSGNTNTSLSSHSYYIRNNSGGYYTDMGAHSAAWSHMVTSAAKFYFNQPISVDTGLIESYNEDMYFTRGTGGTEFARGFAGGVFKPTYISAYDGVAGGSYGRRVVFKGTGDNTIYFGCYEDNGWGYLENMNNSSGMYFNTNQGDFAFDTGNIRPYTDTEISLGLSGYRFSYAYIANEVRCAGDVVAYYSDERLKNIHGAIPNALDKVSSLTGFYYTENEKAKELGYKNDNQQVGVSAQEVQKVLPEAVSLAAVDMDHDPETDITTSKSGEDYLTVKYEKIVPLLIESIKELKAEIDELKKCKCDGCTK